MVHPPGVVTTLFVSLQVLFAVWTQVVVGLLPKASRRSWTAYERALVLVHGSVEGQADGRNSMRLEGESKLCGWLGSILLFVCYVATEFGSRYLINGSAGAFAYVTTHFIVMPLISVILISSTIRKALRTFGTGKKALLLASIVVPCAIILIAATGDPGLSRFMDRFRP